MFASIGVSILSWKASKTLRATLENYYQHNFFSLFSDVCVTLPQASEIDREIVEKYGLRHHTMEDNFGIQANMKIAADQLKTEYILLLENDCPLIECLDEIKSQLEAALEGLQSQSIDVMYLRHRFKRGEQFSGIKKYSRYFEIKQADENFLLNEDVSTDHKIFKLLRRRLNPWKASRLLGNSVFVEKNPDQLFPKYIRKSPLGFFVVDSFCLPWTNQSVLLKKSFFLSLVDYANQHPSSRTVNGFQDLEKPLNSRWWRLQNFKIGIGKGIFTHSRLDR
jgi:glycosyltransferase involved in cell wall biosynthesis